MIIADNQDSCPESPKSQSSIGGETALKIEERVDEYASKVEGYSNQVTDLIKHVDRVNKMNVDLSVELESVYDALAKEKAIAA